MASTVNRTIPLSIRAQLFVSRLRFQVGIAVIGLSFVLFHLLAFHDVVGYWYLSQDISRIEGTTTGSYETNVTVNDLDVYEVHFVFNTPDNVQFKGFSYATNRSMPSGKSVMVQYSPTNPQYAQIEGLRYLALPVYVYLMIFLILIGGFISVLFSIKISLQTLKLLKYGELTKATLENVAQTSMTINDKSVYKLTFGYSNTDKKTGALSAGYNNLVLTQKTHRMHRFAHRQQYDLLYLSEKPTHAMVLDLLPLPVSINPQGHVQPCSYSVIALLLIVPISLIIGLIFLL